MMTAIGINIYAGGFTLGVINSGLFKILGQWEECDIGKKTFDMNFPDIYRPLKFDEWSVEEFSQKVDFVFANPPCLPWSTMSGNSRHVKADRFNDPLLEFTDHTMQAAIGLQPAIFILESVENAFTLGRKLYNDYAKQWMQYGYSITYFLNDALIQGSPSRRKRFHFIAHRYKLDLPQDPGPFKIYTVHDAIWDLQELGNDYVSLHTSEYYADKLHPKTLAILPQVKPLGKLRSWIKTHPDYTGPKTGFLITKLSWHHPCPTVVGFDNFIHPSGKRFITIREGFRLCSYPDSFNSPKERRTATKAVLPIVAKFLAEMAGNAIKRGIKTSGEFNIIDWRPYTKNHGDLNTHNRQNKKR